MSPEAIYKWFDLDSCPSAHTRALLLFVGFFWACTEIAVALRGINMTYEILVKMVMWAKVKMLVLLLIIIMVTSGGEQAVLIF